MLQGLYRGDSGQQSAELHHVPLTENGPPPEGPGSGVGGGRTVITIALSHHFPNTPQQPTLAEAGTFSLAPCA